MNKMLSFANVALLLIVTVLTTDVTQRFPTFQRFMQKFNKTYSQTQIGFRQSVYNQNIQKIKQRNRPNEGVTLFADLTEDQFNQKFLNQQKFFQERKLLSNSFKRSSLASSKGMSVDEDLPKSFDWRQHIDFTPVKSQGGCGSCWAHSAMAYFQQEFIRKGLANESLDLSEQFLVTCDKTSLGCAGGYLDKPLQFIIDHKSVPFEADFPYTETNGEFSEQKCSGAQGLSLVDEEEVVWEQGVNQIKTLQKILLQKPINIGIAGTDLAYYYTFFGNETFECFLSEKLNHAVLLVGYTENAWIIKNSWGPYWGVNGYGYISRDPNYDCLIGQEIALTLNLDPKAPKCQKGLYAKYLTNLTFTKSWKCVPCNEQCLECVDGKKCTLCKSPSIYLEGKCLQSCPANYYTVNIAGSSVFCIQCEQQTCDSSKTLTSCPQDSFYFNQTCTKTCPDGYFKQQLTSQNSTTYQCSKCMENCKKCINDLNCEQCAQGLQFNTSSNQCVLPNSSQVDETDCPDHCANCNLKKECTQCQDGFVLNSKSCEACKENCKKCDLAGCSQCLQGYELHNLSCRLPCSVSHCLQCSEFNSSECISCYDSFQLHEGICQIVCPPNCSTCDINGTCTQCKQGYELKIDNVCGIPCPKGCVKCNNAGKCSQCSSNLTLRNNQCIIPCGDGCEICDQSDPSFCLLCSPFYYTINTSSCVLFCPAGYYLSGRNSCLKCQSSNCAFCSEPYIDRCSACNSGYYVDRDTYQCNKYETNCSNGYYLSVIDIKTKSGICLKCGSNCYKCNISGCITCATGYQPDPFRVCTVPKTLGFKLTLGISLKEYKSLSTQIIKEILSVLGSQFASQSQYLTISSVVEGSVIITGSLTVPPTVTLTQVESNIQKQIMQSGTIAGVSVLSLTNFEPNSQQTSNQVLPYEDEPSSSSPTLIIILSVVGAIVSIVIILIVVFYIIKRRKTRKLQEAEQQNYQNTEKNIKTASTIDKIDRADNLPSNPQPYFETYV